ncbi:MAG: argininosuccinate lyase [Candidatus Jordarchaeales archaeon]|nr:argininosuccinate lyase [Candidatus Jordarchaeia archaeon]
MSDKIWGGVFKEKSLKDVEQYTSRENIQLDERLVRYDIFGTIAHDYMLWKIGALGEDALKKIISALLKIKEEHEKSSFHLKIEFEDVHMNIEQKVIELAGSEAGGMMHLARSRNDQVLVDIRMYLRDEINELTSLLLDLIETFISLAKGHVKTVMPAFTHTRPAQPTSFAHWCLASSDSLLRCVTRLNEHYKRVNTCPLGAGAVSGVGWPIDRTLTASLLGFDALHENTLDAISSRGEMEAETLFILSLIMLNLSRISEDLIWWSTPEFSMVELDERYTTGSSIMPQKKNPDVLELVRGRSSRIQGNLVSMLSLLKSLPSGYNRDQQETKFLLFNSIDIVKETLAIMIQVIGSLKVNEKRMVELAKLGMVTATELVDLLVRKGVPFRIAHRAVGEYLKKSSSNIHDPELLSKIVATISKIQIELSSEELSRALDPLEALERRRHAGAPSPDEVARMLSEREKLVRIERENLNHRKEKIRQAFHKLEEIAFSLIR